MTVLSHEERHDIAAKTAVHYRHGKAQKAFLAVALVGVGIASAAELGRGAYYHADLLDPKTMSETMKMFLFNGKGVGQAMYYMMVPYAIAQEALMKKALKAKEFVKATKDRSHIAGAMLMTAGLLHQVTHMTSSGGKGFDVKDVAGYAIGVTMAVLASKFATRKAAQPSEKLDQKIEENIQSAVRLKKRTLAMG